MAIFFTSGIETEVDAFTTEFTGKAGDGTNTLLTSAVAADINSGSKGAKVEVDHLSTRMYGYKDFSDSTEHWFRGYVRLDSDLAFGAAYWDMAIFKCVDDTTGVWDFAVRSDPALNTFHWRMQANDNGSQTEVYKSSPDTVVLNQWYLIEVHWKAGTGADGGAEIKIDGVSVGSNFTLNCSPYAVDSFRFGHTTTSTRVSLPTGMAFDDMALDDSGWIGGTPPTFLFDNDFEEGDLSEFTGSIATTGTIAASTSASKNGTYGARATYEGSDGDLRVYETLAGAEDTIYARMWIRFSSGFTVAAAFKQMRIMGISEATTGAPLVAVAIQETATDHWAFRIQFNYGGFTSTASSDIGALGTDWYRVELYSHNNGGAGDDTIRAKIYDHNGDPVWDSGDFTETSVDYDLDVVSFGGSDHTGDPANGDYMDIDDCAAGIIGWLGDITEGAIVEQDPIGALELAGFNPIVGSAIGQWPIGAYIYDVTREVKVNPTPGTLVLAGLNPTVGALGAGVEIDATLGMMILGSLNPTVGATSTKADRKPNWDWTSVWRRW